MLSGYYLIDRPRSGIDNMVIDQAMLEQTARDAVPRVRFYRWEQPTVSLGYFQRYGEFAAFQPTSGLKVVRRATGGGAIVHHHDWTYSLTVSAASLAARPAMGPSPGLYECVHQAVVQWLKRLGLDARLATATCPPAAAAATCPFLCFERRHVGDVLVGNSNLLGSAQRRLGTALLQHGSLLLSTSPHAPSLTGILELLPTRNELDLADWADSILQNLAHCYELTFSPVRECQPWVEVSEAVRDRLESRLWTARI